MRLSSVTLPACLLIGLLLSSAAHAEPVESLKNGILVVVARINGSPVCLMVDTGASRTVLDAGVAKRIGIRSVVTDDRAAGVGGKRLWIESSVHNRLEIGSVATENVKIGVMDLSSASSAILEATGRRVDGVLGADWLRAHNATISYSGLSLVADSGAR